MTQDEYYPTTDAAFLNYLCATSPKLESVEHVGDTFIYVLKGEGPEFKRTLYVRTTKIGVLDYYASFYIAFRLRRMNELTDWWEQNRNWKDGAYFVNK